MLLAPAPVGWTDLATAGLRLEIRYATADNFTGAPLPGYGAAGAWLRTTAASALLRVEAALRADGRALLVFDAYRPARASRAMVEWTARTGNAWVLAEGYVAEKSFHNRGNTVDVTLWDVATGSALDMGNAFDEFSAASHTANATGVPLANRLALRRAMTDAGFEPYEKEWWHFHFPMADAPPIDVPYGVGE